MNCPSWLKKLAIILGIIVIGIASYCIYYSDRFTTINSITSIHSYKDGMGIYTMTVKYDYNLNNIIKGDINSDNDYIKAIANEIFPGLPIPVKSPKFACSAFSTRLKDGGIRMGRNYDFLNNTSAMIVFNAPKDGYKSISIADLNHIGASFISFSTTAKIVSLIAPFAVVDGINEKGVSIAVLATDSPATHQNNGKADISTTLAVRLVLDKAASTEEAIALLSKYDMYAVSGYDYHFYITDAQGDGRVIDYDPCSKKRDMIATKISAVTNFYTKYVDKVERNQKNGIYGYGKERWDTINDILRKNQGNMTEEIAWYALRAASQKLNKEDMTSNTQWSIVYNNTNCSLDFVSRRDWKKKYHFSVANLSN